MVMCTHSSVFERRRKFTSNHFSSLPTAEDAPIALIIRKAVLKPQIQVVIKSILRSEAECQKQQEAAIRREVTICCILLGQTPHVLHILGTIELDEYLPPSPVFEYYPNGTLTKHIKISKASHSSRLALLKQVVEGVGHIHKLGIIHGDLKGDNVLVDDQTHAKICDFGSSFVKNCKCEVGCPEDVISLLTERYMSPEVCKEESAPTIQSDIWALGCLLLEAQLGIRAYSKSHHAVIRHVIKGLPPATPEVLEKDQDPIAIAVAKIIQRCWRREPAERPTAQALLDRFNEVRPAPDA